MLNFTQAANLAKKLDVNFKQIQNGFQFKKNKVVATIYKNGIHCNNPSYWVHKYKQGEEESIILKMLNLDKITSLKRRNQLLQDKGVAACIRHIERKLQSYIDTHPTKLDNSTATMLKNLIVELDQYSHFDIGVDAKQGEDKSVIAVIDNGKPVMVEPYVNIGTLVALKTSFLGQSVGTRCITYSKEERIAGILSEHGVNIGYFTTEEIIEHLEFLQHTALEYSFKSAIQLQEDFEKGIFKAYFK